MLDETDVVFFSQGVPLAGRIVRNTQDESEPQPVVDVGRSRPAVKEQMPLVYARRLVAAGFAAFVRSLSFARGQRLAHLTICACA